MSMDFKRALSIVVDLASQNMLDEADCEDNQNLIKEVHKQEKAVNKVLDFIKTDPNLTMDNNKKNSSTDVGKKVYWRDLDGEFSSGWYTITDITGEIITLKNDTGSTIEALPHEISYPLSDEEYVNKSGNVCPFCLNENIEAEKYAQIDGASASQEVICNDCGEEWVDVYELKGYEQTEK